MSEPQLWITGPSGAWFMPQRKVTPPIRRGTARRLGIIQPMLANFEANRHVVEEAFRRFSFTIGAARLEETP